MLAAAVRSVQLRRMADEECAGSRGIVEEFAGAFRDKRRDARLGRIAESIAAQPTASFPKIFDDDAQLEAAYRFFSSVHVTPAAILLPHVERTKARAAAEARVLVIHDSTDFTFRPDGQRRGLGRSRSATQTFYGHFSLVVAADGSRRPLGVAEMTTWVRPKEASRTERQRWLKQITSTQRDLALQSPPIHVCDREADDYAMFERLVTSDTRFVIRAKSNRRLSDDQLRASVPIREALAVHDVLVERTASLTRRRVVRSPVKTKVHPPRAPRVARLSMAAARFVLRVPAHYESKHPDRGPVSPTIPVNVVRVWEADPPEGCDPVEWFLFTNEPVDTAEQVLAIVDHYRARWVIEELFKALKTGCALESRQLEEYESLTNVVAVCTPIAYDALRLRTVARAQPDAPASTVITDTQLEVLRATGRRSLPPNATARDVLLAIAALGGHIKYAPDPGWQTIFLGYQTLLAREQGWLAAQRKFQPHSDQR